MTKYYIGIDFGASKTFIIGKKEEEGDEYQNLTPAISIRQNGEDYSSSTKTGVDAMFRWDPEKSNWSFQNEISIKEDFFDKIKKELESTIDGDGDDYKTQTNFFEGIFYQIRTNDPSFLNDVDNLTICVGYPPNGLGEDGARLYTEKLRTIISKGLEAALKATGCCQKLTVELLDQAEPILGLLGLMANHIIEDSISAYIPNKKGLVIDIGHSTLDYAIVQYNSVQNKMKIYHDLVGGTKKSDDLGGLGVTHALHKLVKNASRRYRNNDSSSVRYIRLLDQIKREIFEDGSNAPKEIVNKGGETIYIYLEKPYDDAKTPCVEIMKNGSTSDNAFEEVYKDGFKKIKAFLAEKVKEGEKLAFIAFVGAAAQDGNYTRYIKTRLRTSGFFVQNYQVLQLQNTSSSNDSEPKPNGTNIVAWGACYYANNYKSIPERRNPVKIHWHTEWKKFRSKPNEGVLLSYGNDEDRYGKANWFRGDFKKGDKIYYYYSFGDGKYFPPKHSELKNRKEGDDGVVNEGGKGFYRKDFSQDTTFIVLIDNIQTDAMRTILFEIKADKDAKKEGKITFVLGGEEKEVADFSLGRKYFHDNCLFVYRGCPGRKARVLNSPQNQGDRLFRKEKIKNNIK